MTRHSIVPLDVIICYVVYYAKIPGRPGQVPNIERQTLEIKLESNAVSTKHFILTFPSAYKFGLNRTFPAPVVKN